MKRNTSASTLGIFLLLAAFFFVGCGAMELPGASSATTASVAPSAVPVQPTVVEATPEADPLLQLATIESLQVLTGEGADGETSVQLRGLLPSDCATIDNIVTERTANGFSLVVLAVQRPGENCSTEAVPFEEIVVLDVSGLEPGSYQVTANDRTVSFNLDGEGESPPAEEATPTATAVAQPEQSAISGVVWHDLCANTPANAEEVPAGCVLTGANALLADGQRQDEEEGIAGVQVALGEGACPATAVTTVSTDSDGAFQFTDLPAATYCVFVDMDDTLNQDLLGDGFWTSPEGEFPQQTVTLGEGPAGAEILFGWDYLNLPAAEVDLANCRNSFAFVQDLSIPDDTVFPPGAEFTKEWQLRNNGTCPWSTEYSVVFVGGDQMGAADAYLLQAAVAPGQTLDVAIDMVAPAEPGTYRGNWQVADANGEPFGIDGFIEDAFWLQIVVEEDAPPPGTPQPDSAVLGGVVWDDFCLNSNPGAGCVETPVDSGIFVADGSFGANEAPLSGIEITLADGLCPADGTLPAAGALLDTAVTDAAGLYQFAGLSAGSYCVFMDALSENMVDLLIPGNWTWPATGVGYYSVVLDPGEQILDLDFGWDFVD